MCKLSSMRAMRFFVLVLLIQVSIHSQETQMKKKLHDSIFLLIRWYKSTSKTFVSMVKNSQKLPLTLHFSEVLQEIDYELFSTTPLPFFTVQRLFGLFLVKVVDCEN